MAKFTQIPTNTFKKLQLNAGILASDFDPVTGELAAEDIIGATTGGVAFEATPEYTDFGEDIDNCPKNTKELKKTDSWECIMSGSFVTMDTAVAKQMIGTADIDKSDPTKVTPRNEVAQEDFADIRWVGDYSDINNYGTSTGTAGFIAIHLMNALSTGGFKVQSSDKAKGTFEFEFTGHYSMANIDQVPFEVFVKTGTADSE